MINVVKYIIKMKKEMRIEELVDNNVMSPEELLKYIHGNIPFSPNEISSVVVYKNYRDTDEVLRRHPGSLLVNTSRRDIFFDQDTKTVLIPTNEGDLKGFQYETQVRMLNFLSGKKISYKEFEIHPEKELWEEWTARLLDKLRQLSMTDVSGIVVGSINNSYFRFSRYLRHPVISNLDQFYKSILSTKDFQNYLNYRLDLILAEEDFVSDRNKFDRDLFIDFQLKPIPSPEDYERCSAIQNVIVDRQNRLRQLTANEVLTDYIKADYVYSLDRLNQTNNISPVFQSSNPVVIRDPLMNFQLLKVGKTGIINFDWVSSSQIRKAIESVTNLFNIVNFYNFGKCGYLGRDLRIGDFVRPIACKIYPDGDEEISINNEATHGIESKNLTVDSPLLETRPGLTSEITNNAYSSIEMELFHMLKALNPKSRKFINYYISDMPLADTNLSTRLDSLVPRLTALEDVFNQIVQDYCIAQ